MRKFTSFSIISVQIGSVFALLYFLYGDPKCAEKGSVRVAESKVEKLVARNRMLHENVRELAQKLEKIEVDNLGQKSKGSQLIEHNDVETHFEELDGCEVIHITMVVSGATTVKRFIVVVKSILFHSKNFVHFHLLTDPMGQRALSIIFETWRLPRVRMSFYSLPDAMKRVEHIPTSHYSGIYAMTKLTLPYVLPDSLQEVLVLDSDLLLAGDIGQLWSFLRVMKRKRKMLGLVENQSDWYLLRKYNPWPAVGRGYNSGVILLDLRLMRERKWRDMWQEAAKEGFVKHDKTPLADQDIINAAAKREGDIVLILPCVWNVQLSDNTLSENCFKAAHRFKLVHWNSAAKLDVKNVHAEYFRNQHSLVANMDSYLFRSFISDCPSKPSSKQPEDQEGKGPCYEFKDAANLTYKVHPHYLDYAYKSKGDNDVTMVTQLSVDRLHMLDALCKLWTGPLSISLYASDADLVHLEHLVSSSPILRKYKKLALHIVFKQGKYYPVNVLRNVALNASTTPYVFFSDIDFLPSANLYEYAREAVRVLGNNRSALIVPAFESLQYRVKLPANKSELISMLDRNELFTFRYYVWKEGHAPTNYDHWRAAHRPYKVSWAENFEPYIIVHKNVSSYDRRFIGFGWNKVSHIMELSYQGYSFIVLPEAYMIHLPHAPSADVAAFRQSKSYRGCMQIFKKEFRKEMKVKYRTSQS